jgi:tRNA(fMet)-specific endonuclease VapC
MSLVLLDTSAYTAAKKNHPDVTRTLEEAESILMTPTVIGEVLSGFRKGDYYERNERDLETFLSTAGVKLIPIDKTTAERYALIHDYLRRAGTPVSPNDIWIAASAMQHGATLLTADSDYQRIPQIHIAFYHPL